MVITTKCFPGQNAVSTQAACQLPDIESTHALELHIFHAAAAAPAALDDLHVSGY